MSTSPQTELPRREFAAGWHTVGTGDRELIGRWLAVMYRMGLQYEREGVDDFLSWVLHTQGAAYYYTGAQGEIALRFTYLRRRQQYQLMSVGFTGPMSAVEALDATIDKSIEFMRERGICSLFAIRPKQMGNEGIMEFHDLVPAHPRARVTVEKDLPGAAFWNIAARELEEEA